MRCVPLLRRTAQCLPARAHTAAIGSRAVPRSLLARRLISTAGVSLTAASASATAPPPLPAPYIPFSPLPAAQLSEMAASNASHASQLRALLAKHEVAAYLIPTADAHQSEYVSEADQRRAFLTGFTGSAGTAVVLAQPFDSNTPGVTPAHGPAGVTGRLWTDGRYFLQAQSQLDPKEFTLMKAGVEGVPKLEEWLLAVLPQGAKVAVDPTITNMASYKSLKNTFKDRLQVVFLERNLVDEVWGAARPSYSKNPLLLLPESYTGESSSSKIQRIRAKMADNHAALLVVCALDEVAWLFNLRGADIPFNPVFRSYAVVTADSATLYLDVEKVTPEIKAHLGEGVTVRPYDAIWKELAAHAQHSRLSATHRAWLDPARASAALQNLFAALPADAVYEADNPIQLMKCVKNDREISGMRQAHVKDAAAVINFLSWLEIQLLEEKRTDLNEVSVADRLEAFRAEQPDFVGLSFDTISASGPNGAIIHYKPEVETARKVSTQEMFLLDSGAQFKDGTTDITRTVHFGTPSAFEREAFTRVLQGHIQLAQAVFPPGTVGPTLDSMARASLWSVGLDYVHGTGHGVGAFLNVHEGPCGISSSGRSHAVLSTALQSGMILSNEPGFYQDGQFGIRIESLLVVAPRATTYRFQEKQFLGFETITLVPLQRGLMDLALLTPGQIEWINRYHAECREKVAPLLKGRALEWLVRETEPIVKA